MASRWSMVAIHHAVHSSSLWLLSQQYDTVERHNSVNVSNQTEANKFVKNLPQNKAGIMVKPPQGGTLPSESTLTGMRKTLVQQQGEVTLKDPTTHAARQVRELDTFAGAMMNKKQACLAQIEQDRRELAQIESRIENETKKYENLLESLEFRRAERDRIRRHLCQCSEDNQLLIKNTSGRARWVRRQDSKTLKSVSSAELKAARGYSSGLGSTFSRKRLRDSASRSGSITSAQTLPPLSGSGGATRPFAHSVSAPVLRR